MFKSSREIQSFHEAFNLRLQVVGVGKQTNSGMDARMKGFVNIGISNIDEQPVYLRELIACSDPVRSIVFEAINALASNNVEDFITEAEVSAQEDFKSILELEFDEPDNTDYDYIYAVTSSFVRVEEDTSVLLAWARILDAHVPNGIVNVEDLKKVLPGAIAEFWKETQSEYSDAE